MIVLEDELDAVDIADDAAQVEWRKEIGKHIPTTEVLDRDYFHSIYFREPGGVLFEIATDPPGFARDEPENALGQVLKLPPWLEQHRTEIEGELPKLHHPNLAGDKE